MTKAAGRLCYFCNEPISKNGKSREHVFPGWLLRLLDAEQVGMPLVVHKAPEGINSHDVTEQRTFAHPDHHRVQLRSQVANSFLAGSICKRKCNEAWMSHLEVAAKPIIVRLK